MCYAQVLKNVDCAILHVINNIQYIIYIKVTKI